MVGVASWPATPAWRKAAARLKVMSRPPEPCISRRRVTLFACIVCLLSRLGRRAGGALHRADDAHMRAATAEISRQCLPDVRFARLVVLVQQGGRRHHHAGDAVAALRRLLVEKGLLDGMWIVKRTQSLQRGDLLAGCVTDRVDAGANGLAVDVDSARAALRKPAAKL